ncbi:MAG: hypothetical protein JRH19_22575, partial [Deltaproteobacteria bacterium]|nr:hypothetical protein [Deltaproteobacteria bacterium]
MKSRRLLSLLLLRVLLLAFLAAACSDSDPLTDRARSGDAEAQLALARRLVEEGRDGA